MADMELKSILQGMARNAILLDIPGENGTVVGHFGGLPDVPGDFAWPAFETNTYYDKEVKPRPLSFMAQFDCAALAEFDSEGLLPKTGVLSFFYELGSMGWGFDPKELGCARTYWFPDKSVLSPMEPPETLEEDFRLPNLDICAHSEALYPDYEDFCLAHPELTHPGQSCCSWNVFNALKRELSKGERERFHKLLGWPDIIQNNMTGECELVTRGYSTGSSLKDIPKEAVEAAMHSIEEWCLLFQLDSLAAKGFDLCFGDNGSIYFYIRKSDLLAQRFDRVWLILQCY